MWQAPQRGYSGKVFLGMKLFSRDATLDNGSKHGLASKLSVPLCVIFRLLLGTTCLSLHLHAEHDNDSGDGSTS